MAKPKVEAACAVIQQDGKILIAQRKPMDRFGLMWEFPGGRLEPGESSERAVVRELQEELGIAVSVTALLSTVGYEYPDRLLTLHFYRCAIARGTPKPIDCHALKWVRPEELGEYGFPPADREVIKLFSRRAGTAKGDWFQKTFHGT